MGGELSRHVFFLCIKLGSVLVKNLQLPGKGARPENAEVVLKAVVLSVYREI